MSVVMNLSTSFSNCMFDPLEASSEIQVTLNDKLHDIKHFLVHQILCWQHHMQESSSILLETAGWCERGRERINKCSKNNLFYYNIIYSMWSNRPSMNLNHISFCNYVHVIYRVPGYMEIQNWKTCLAIGQSALC